MSVVAFDIETNGIEDFQNLTDLHTIHCLVIRWRNDVKVFTGDEITTGLKLLAIQDVIVGHNSISFDLPAIKKLYPWWKPEGCSRDSMVMARLAWSDQRNLDFSNQELPKHLIGSHSLKAWGYRLGEHKGEYEGGWDTLTDDMIEYCKQDTKVTLALYEAAYEKLRDIEAIILEHDFHEIICEQERTGFGFNTIKAAELYSSLAGKRSKLKSQLSKSYPPQIERMKTPEYWVAGDTHYKTKTEAKAAGNKVIVKGPLRTKTVPFNPDSRLQIAQFLMDKHGWEPKAYTPSGQPQVDESILTSLDIPEAAMLTTYLTISKRIGQLAEGKEAWLRVEKEGRIHGRVNSNGTVTGRCTHSRPNLSATPASSAEYGVECRSLFTAGPKKVLVGVDLSGLELRCLAHYMARYDGGAYARAITQGDIHTVNQKAAGLATRDEAKTLIYCLIYGGGPQTVGSIVNGGVREGRNLTNRFLDRMPALRTLRRQVQRVAKSRKYLLALDGRPIPVRSAHSSLNALLQSCGSILTKKATTLIHRQISIWAQGNDILDKAHHHIKQVAHIHDEIQFECNEFMGDTVGVAAVDSIERAGKFFDLRCPLDGQYKVGKTWADTH